MENESKRVVYTEDARRKLEQVKQAFVDEIERRFTSEQFSPADEAIEITARDVAHYGETVLKGRPPSYYGSRRFEMRRIVAGIYMAVGLVTVFVGFDFKLFRDLIEYNPMQLILVAVGIAMAAIGFYFYSLTAKKEAELKRLMYLDKFQRDWPDDIQKG